MNRYAAALGLADTHYANPIGPDQRGNHPRAAVTWTASRDLSAVAGEVVRFRFTVTRGRLFSFWVSPAPDGTSRGTYANFQGDPTAVGSITKGASAVNWFTDAEKAQFTTPDVGGYGAGRNIFTGPGFFQTDFSLHKAVQFSERYRVELRGEAFNVFNNVNFSQPNVTSTNAAFGVISSLRVPPRILQVAAKFVF